jgi:hypothetical protein
MKLNRLVGIAHSEIDITLQANWFRLSQQHALG